MQKYRSPSYFMNEGAIQTASQAVGMPKIIPPDCLRFFVDSWAPKPEKNLYFFGVPGNGKTTLAKYAYHFLVQNGIWTRFINMQELVEEVKERHKAGVATSEIIERYLDCDFLIIDDLGTEERITTYGESSFRSIVYPIINARYDVSPVLPTMITSNLSPQALCDFYADKDPLQASRFRSRLLNDSASHIIQVDSETFRKETEQCSNIK